MAVLDSPGSARVAGVDVSTDHYIGGQRVASPERFADHSPIDWALLARGRRAEGRARRGCPRAPRATRSPHGPRSAPRAAAVPGRLADLIERDVERLARVECDDMAMLQRSLRARVILRGARNYRSYADLAEGYEERRWSSNGTANQVIRMPAGPAV